VDADLKNLPPDHESLAAILRSLSLERDQQRQRANDLQAENLRQSNALTNSSWKTYGCNWSWNATRSGATDRERMSWRRAKI